MSTRSEDEPRPEGTRTSERNTARDVPAAKFKDGSVGTLAPRGLRGPSLVPGQGAPERIVPEEVELAMLRDADTLDGPTVGRARAPRPAEPARVPSPSPSPTAVAVEIPRPRSISPSVSESAITPTSKVTRSIQSGTLISIGSVDPRAPTELSLPSPRPLSVSERAAYMGPEAVVDRSQPPPPRELPGVAERNEDAGVTLRPGLPISERGMRPSSEGKGAPRSQPSRTPVSLSANSDPLRPALETPKSSAKLPVSSMPPSPPRFQIHSQVDALPQQYQDDAFDLRSVATQREPLASRKPLDSSDYVLQRRAAEDAPRASDPDLRASGRSSSQDAPRSSEHDRTVPPTTGGIVARRNPVPLSWIVGGVIGTVLVAMIAAWVLRVPAAPDPLVGTDHASASAPVVLPSPDDRPLPEPPASNSSGAAIAQSAHPRPSAVRVPSPASKTATAPRSSTSATPAAPTQLPESDPNSKLRSIY